MTEEQEQTDIMNETNKCPKCGAQLPPSVPRGLCPACLLKCGLKTNTVGFSEGEADCPAASSRWQPPTVEQLSAIFPELEIIELIGRGGMGAVYKAREKQLDRLVALKILPPEIGKEEAFAQRFAREAQAMAKLSHPNIVTIHSFGQRAADSSTSLTAGDLYFFIMEYVDGLSLRQLLDVSPERSRRGGNVAPKEALAIVPQICDALQYAHDRGIVHRDIKPENILLNRDGQVKIADFGLAKLVGIAAKSDVTAGPTPPGEAQPVITRLGEKVMGTPQYMAPEQIDNPREVDHRADIYSLGVVFYQMLTGELPSKASAKDGLFEPPSRKVLIDVRLDEVVLRALEREPARRYQQVSEVRTEVETIVSTAVNQQQRSASSESSTGGQHQPWPSASTTRQSPPWEPSNPPEAAAQVDHARRAVKAPAIGMIVAAGINAIPTVGLLGMLVFKLVAAIGFGRFDISSAFSFSWLGVIVSSLLLLSIPVTILILLGAMRMMRLRNRGLAITAAILALIAAPGNLIGLPMGIWALVVLARREVAEAFCTRRATPISEQPRSSSGKVASRVLLAINLVLLAVFALILGPARNAYALIFADMRVDLPMATRSVLSINPWLGYLLAGGAAVLLIAKEFIPHKTVTLIINAVGVLTLGAACVLCWAALHLPVSALITSTSAAPAAGPVSTRLRVLICVLALIGVLAISLAIVARRRGAWSRHQQSGRGQDARGADKGIVLVGTRGGKPVVNWRDVILFFVFSAAVGMTAALVFNIFTDGRYPDIVSVFFNAYFFGGIAVTVTSILHSLRHTPPEKLPPLDQPGPKPAKRSRFRRWVLWPVVVIALALLVRQYVLGVYHIKTSALRAEVPRGSLVFVFKPARTFEPGNVIVYRHGRNAMVARVVEGGPVDNLLVQRNDEPPYRVAGSDVVGLVVLVARSNAGYVTPPATRPAETVTFER
jgi:serine/threonine protein kinase